MRRYGRCLSRRTNVTTPKAPAPAGLCTSATPASAGAPPADQIIVVPYDSAWPQRFRVESQLIEMALADLQPMVEHIGSTSVPGLDAKPTIDMLVGVRSLEDFGRHADLLIAYGYEYIPEYERVLPDRRFFKRVVRGVRTHHVHVVEFGGPYWQRYMAFRDSLRRDAGLAARYAELKRSLAMRHRFDRDGYTNGKTGFVESVLAGCAPRGAGRAMAGQSAARTAAAPCDARRHPSERADPDTSAPAARGGQRFRPHFGFAS